MSNNKYPWDRWFNRKRPFRLKRGRDFHCMIHSMAVHIRDMAQQYDVRVSIQTEEGEVLRVTVTSL
jgi:hypothetical protein